jgi:hypothetical protein
VKDYHAGKYTIAKAKELCNPDPKCLCFTYVGSVDTNDEVDVWFKSTLKGDLVQNEEWSVFAKVRCQIAYI